MGLFLCIMAIPSTSSKTRTAGISDAISLSKLLPLGITANVKDAYFNHKSIIWHYHNRFAVGDNDSIYIEGYFNAYIGRKIHAQNSGANYLSVSGWTNTTESQNNDYGTTLSNGVYNNSVGLTSVCSLSGMWSSNAKADVYGIDNQDLSNNS